MINTFRLPIETIDKVKKIENNIIEDIELNEKDDRKSLYSYLFRYSNKYGKKMVEKWNKVFTDDVTYLNETKNMIKNYNCNTSSIVCETWEEIKTTDYFIEKYYYIDWSYFKFLNNYSYVHQILSVYRILSPICTFILPLVILLSSWFLMRLSGVKMDFSTFFKFMKLYLKQYTSIGKIFQSFSSSSASSKCYAIFSIIMYFLQIYNNVMVVINFNKNLGQMHGYIDKINKYMIETSNNMREYSNLISKYNTYAEFNKELIWNCQKLEETIVKLKNIPKTHKSLVGASYVGYVQKIIYQFYTDDELNSVMNYSFGFNGYIDNLNGIKENIRLNNISYSKFNMKRKTSFKDAYYPPLLEKDENKLIVKNTYKLDKEMLISGPNASGKTTVLKTTLFNIICSQQIGLGFYKKANIKVYSNIFCYLNIPDTSGRDSLFQAEARRCVDIIDNVNLTPHENTFCIFDELYSGTNHYEAISSAYSFLNYLVNNYNFHFMMSTHFIDLCEKLEKNNKKIGNMKMCVTKKGDDFVYSYKMKPGISIVKGGVKVLIDLNYPQDIVKNTKKFLEEEF